MVHAGLSKAEAGSGSAVEGVAEVDQVAQAEHGQTEEREPLKEFCRFGKSERAAAAEEMLC